MSDTLAREVPAGAGAGGDAGAGGVGPGSGGGRGEGDPGGASARRRIAPFVALSVAVVMGLLLWVLAGARSRTGESADTHLRGKPAPEVRSTTLDGAPFDLARRKGSWVVLNFFNSTCVPCVQEHPELVRFAAQQGELGSEGAELYTVIWNQSAEPVAEFFAANGGDWPVIRDDGTIGVRFGVAQVPETWIVSPEGYVLGRLVGAITADRLGTMLQQLREERAAAGAVG